MPPDVRVESRDRIAVGMVTMLGGQMEDRIDFVFAEDALQLDLVVTSPRTITTLSSPVASGGLIGEPSRARGRRRRLPR